MGIKYESDKTGQPITDPDRVRMLNIHIQIFISPNARVEINKSIIVDMDEQQAIRAAWANMKAKMQVAYQEFIQEINLL